MDNAGIEGEGSRLHNLKFGANHASDSDGDSVSAVNPHTVVEVRLGSWHSISPPHSGDRQQAQQSDSSPLGNTADGSGTLSFTGVNRHLTILKNLIQSYEVSSEVRTLLEMPLSELNNLMRDTLPAKVFQLIEDEKFHLLEELLLLPTVDGNDVYKFPRGHGINYLIILLSSRVEPFDKWHIYTGQTMDFPQRRTSHESSAASASPKQAIHKKWPKAGAPSTDVRFCVLADHGKVSTDGEAAVVCLVEAILTCAGKMYKGTTIPHYWDLCRELGWNPPNPHHGEARLSGLEESGKAISKNMKLYWESIPYDERVRRIAIANASNPCYSDDPVEKERWRMSLPQNTNRSEWLKKIVKEQPQSSNDIGKKAEWEELNNQRWKDNEENRVGKQAQDVAVWTPTAALLDEARSSNFIIPRYNSGNTLRAAYLVTAVKYSAWRERINDLELLAAVAYDYLRQLPEDKRTEAENKAETKIKKAYDEYVISWVEMFRKFTSCTRYIIPTITVDSGEYMLVRLLNEQFGVPYKSQESFIKTKKLKITTLSGDEKKEIRNQRFAFRGESTTVVSVDEAKRVFGSHQLMLAAEDTVINTAAAATESPFAAVINQITDHVASRTAATHTTRPANAAAAGVPMSSTVEVSASGAGNGPLQSQSSFIGNTQVASLSVQSVSTEDPLSSPSANSRPDVTLVQSLNTSNRGNSGGSGAGGPQTTAHVVPQSSSMPAASYVSANGSGGPGMYSVGDEVFMKTSEGTKGFDYKWEGPYKITKISQKGYKLQTLPAVTNKRAYSLTSYYQAANLCKDPPAKRSKQQGLSSYFRS